MDTNVSDDRAASIFKDEPHDTAEWPTNSIFTAVKTSNLDATFVYGKCNWP
jgi:hypothetical protein